MTFTRRARKLWKFLRSEETPRDSQERADLYRTILSSTYLNLRRERFPCSPLSLIRPRSSTSTSAADDTKITDQLSKLIDESADFLDTNTGVHQQGIKGLRYELQNILSPEILQLFQSFEEVDKIISTGIKGHDDDNFCKPILLAEYQKTLDTINIKKRSENNRGGETGEGISITQGSNQLEFFKRKKGAIETILDYKDWQSDLIDIDVKRDEQIADNFGYFLNSSCEINKAIRYHQMLNLTKSIILSEKLGYSVISLKSTIPNAGRGVFVDGFAPAGSIISFFPGLVWPKEYLFDMKFVSSAFMDDPNYHLSLRYDDIVIDSRQSPYTVLNEKESNPFSIGHIVNHPQKNISPNCSTVMLNFLEKMKFSSRNLDKYIPNSYAKSPMIIGPKALDRDVINMHGLGLVASRDLCNEELFYDYRLSPGSEGKYPSWFHICNKEEIQNRWFRNVD